MSTPAGSIPTPAASAPTRTVDITLAPRAVITFASGLVHRVFGERPTAQDNAWQAVLADRERAAQRAEVADARRLTSTLEH